MTTYAVFPGLEALFQAKLNRRWLANETVRATFDEVSSHLSKMTGLAEDIAGFIENNSRPHLADLDRTFIAHTAIQVGIWRAVAHQLPVDGLAGCSVGDLARIHISGALDLHDTIDLVWRCTIHRKDCPPGRMANVRPVEGRFTPDQIAWLEGCGISMSMWSDRHAALAGTQDAMDAIAEPARSEGLKVRQIYDYPFHSEVMRPLADALSTIGNRWDVQPVTIPVFSSVWLRHISEPAEIRLEALAGACEPVRWKDAVDLLHREHGVTRLLNIGPSDTLTGWIEASAAHGRLKVIDAWELAEGRTEAA